MIELHSYADESGLEANPNYFVLAGYIASPHQWKLFSHDWQSVLQEFHVSCFHSTDFFPPKARQYDETYKSWSDNKSSQFIFRLTEAVNNYGIHPIGCAIDVPAFNSFTIGERRFLTAGLWDPQRYCFVTNHSGKPSAPYFAAFQYVVRNALDRTPSKGRLNLTFHFQKQMESYAHNAYEAWGLVPRHESDIAKMGILGYEISANSPPLQLADLYTYGWYNFCANGFVKPNNPLLLMAMAQLNKKENGLALFNAEGIEADLQRHLPPEQRAIIRKQK